MDWWVVRLLRVRIYSTAFSGIEAAAEAPDGHDKCNEVMTVHDLRRLGTCISKR
jgi:hypothetical protein